MWFNCKKRKEYNDPININTKYETKYSFYLNNIIIWSDEILTSYMNDTVGLRAFALDGGTVTFNYLTSTQIEQTPNVNTLTDQIITTTSIASTTS